MKVYNKNMELVGVVTDNGEIVKVTADERETMNNLLTELERIAEAVQKFGGVWYGKKDEEAPSAITHLVVTGNASIAAVGYSCHYYSINPVYLDKGGYPIVSTWSCDGSLKGSDNPAIMLDPEKWNRPAYMLYSIDTGEYSIRNKEEMLEKYKNTLDDTEGSAFASLINSKRIGGMYYKNN
jgi:hypothetical protein